MPWWGTCRPTFRLPEFPLVLSQIGYGAEENDNERREDATPADHGQDVFDDFKGG